MTTLSVRLLCTSGNDVGELICVYIIINDVIILVKVTARVCVHRQTVLVLRVIVNFVYY